MNGIIWTIIIGLAIGALTGWVLKNRGHGIILSMIVGLIGSIIGGWVYTLIGFNSPNLFGVLLMSLLGTVIALIILSLVPRKKE